MQMFSETGTMHGKGMLNELKDGRAESKRWRRGVQGRGRAQETESSLTFVH